jgi:hypothetical protein
LSQIEQRQSPLESSAKMSTGAGVGSPFFLTLIAILTETEYLAILPLTHSSDTICETGTCHHFQTRGRQRHFLQCAYASLEWQLRRSQYGLFLRFGILFWFHSMTFGGVIIILWRVFWNSCAEQRNFNCCGRSNLLLENWICCLDGVVAALFSLLFRHFPLILYWGKMIWKYSLLIRFDLALITYKFAWMLDVKSLIILIQPLARIDIY